MIVEIKKFGPIESFTFDLNKDLHFIIGENGVGKSYACYCLYCVLKHFKLMNLVIYPNYIIDSFIGVDAKIENALEQLKNTPEVEVNDIFSDIIKQTLEVFFLPEFRNSILNTFLSVKDLKNKHSTESSFLISIHSSSFELSIGVNDVDEIVIKNCSLNVCLKMMKKENSIDGAMFSIDDRLYPDFNKDNLYGKIAELSTFLLNYKISNNNVKEVIFLPSSRSGLYQALNSFAPILAELAKRRFLFKTQKIDLPQLSEPLSDYFLDISAINKNHVNADLQLIVDKLEKRIIRGKFDYDETSNRIHYKPDNLDLTLDLQQASSMIGELSTVVLTLKHIVNYKASRELPAFGLSALETLSAINGKNKRKTLLFIEEPETHLHPDAQINLMEIFTELVEHNIILILTSHSDYMFNKLNNMILDHKVDPKRIGIYHMINTPKGSIVNPEVQATEDGMIDTNFAKSAEALFEERMEILERHNSTV